eukprot:gene22667-29818_t
MNATVCVGGTACNNVIFVSATSLNCIAPAKSGGIYPIVVINPDSGFSVATHVVVKYNTGGDKLTITRTLFAMGATVSIRGTVCISVIVDNSTSLACVAPATGDTAIVVTIPDTGYSTATAVVVKYAASPASPPTVTAVSPIAQANNFAGGTTITITGTNFIAAPAVSIGGDACISVNVVSAIHHLPSSCYAKSGGIHAVVVTNPDTGHSVATDVVVTYQSVGWKTLSGLQTALTAVYHWREAISFRGSRRSPQ